MALTNNQKIITRRIIFNGLSPIEQNAYMDALGAEDAYALSEIAKYLLILKERTELHRSNVENQLRHAQSQVIILQNQLAQIDADLNVYNQEIG
jgi:hypothetical protein